MLLQAPHASVQASAQAPATTSAAAAGASTGAAAVDAHGLQAYVDQSSRMAAQRHKIGALFQGAAQRRAEDGPASPSAARPVAQRAVGFEFQTYNNSTKLQIVDGTQPKPEREDGEDAHAYQERLKQVATHRATWPREREGGGQGPMASSSRDVVSPIEWIAYPEDVEERYAQGDGVKVEKDGPDLEFVTHAFSESDSGRAGLTQAIRGVILTALALENQLTLTSSIARRGPGLRAGPDARDTVRVKSTGPMKAQVQATVGIRFDALNRFIGLLGEAPKRVASNDLAALFKTELGRPAGRKDGPPQNPSKKLKPGTEMATVLARELGNNAGNATQKTLLRAYQRAAAFANKVLDKIPDEGGKLKGVVHLIGLYIFGSGSKAKYAKARTPVMSRTSLADAIFALPPSQITGFAKLVMPSIAATLGKDGIDMDRTLYEHFPEGEVAAMNLSEGENAAITISKWLNGLIPLDEDQPGEDLTSSFDGFSVIDQRNNVKDPDPTDYGQKWFAGDYGTRMERSTDIGSRETLEGPRRLSRRMDGLVVELRNLGNDNLDVSEWASFALSLFDLVLLVNSDTVEQEAALAQSMREQRTFETDLGDEDLPGIFAGAREILQRQ